jgi:pentatricopeptide repeat protein
VDRPTSVSLHATHPVSDSLVTSTTTTTAPTNGNRSRPSPNAPDTIARTIARLGRQGKTDAALDLWASVDRAHATIRQLNAAVDACARARPARVTHALGLVETAHTLAGPVPNVYTFGALMSVLARAGKAEQAVAWLDTMQDKYGVTPNQVVYHAAISACSKADPPRVDMAMDLLERATRTEGLTLTVVGYNAAVSAAARAGDADVAIRLLQRMETEPALPKPDAVTYGTVLSACAKTFRWNELLHYAARMQERGFGLDTLAATSMLHACQELGLAAQALHVLELCKLDVTYQRRTAGWLVAGRKQPLHGPDAVVYRLVITACARGGAWQDALRVLREYIEVQPERATSEDDVAVYTAAMGALAHAGEWKQAFFLLEQMRKRAIVPNESTFVALLAACATACGHATAHRGHPTGTPLSSGPADGMPLAQRKALQLLSVLKNDPTVVKPNIQVYNAAIRVCAEAMDVDRAFRIVEMLRDEMDSPPTEPVEEEGNEGEALRPNVVTYGTLMTACERVGNVQAASRVFQLLKEDHVPANEIIYGAAISCVRKAGESERAFLLLRKMIRDGLQPNVATFNTVLTAQTEAKPNQCAPAMDRALQVYRMMRQSASSSGYDTAPTRQTYNILIRALAQAQQPHQADSLLRQMRVEGLVPDVDLFTTTVTAYEKAGQPLRALRLMESMREEGYDFYDVPVLNTAFKKAIKLVNTVGRGLQQQYAPNDATKGRQWSDADELFLDGPLSLANSTTQPDAFFGNVTIA